VRAPSPRSERPGKLGQRLRLRVQYERTARSNYAANQMQPAEVGYDGGATTRPWSKCCAADGCQDRRIGQRRVVAARHSSRPAALVQRGRRLAVVCRQVEEPVEFAVISGVLQK